MFVHAGFTPFYMEYFKHMIGNTDQILSVSNDQYQNFLKTQDNISYPLGTFLANFPTS